MLRKKNAKLSRDEHTKNAPVEFRLEQNVPNPFSQKTTIYFSVPRESAIKLAVFNYREELVIILHQGQLSPGRYMLEWAGTDMVNNRLRSGNYVYRLEADGFLASRRLTIKNT